MHTIRQAISAIVVALAFGAALEAQSQRAQPNARKSYTGIAEEDKCP
jgi:hypothetical protein